MLSSALLLEYIACTGCLVCAVYGDGVCCQCMVLVTAASVGAMYGDASVVEELRVYGDASVGAAVSSQRPAASFPVSSSTIHTLPHTSLNIHDTHTTSGSTTQVVKYSMLRTCI